MKAPLPVLQQLVKSGHLHGLTGNQPPQREQASLQALLSIRSRTFLHEYDMLFRRVSLWLFAQGYALTNYQPHHVLACVCALYAEQREVREMISSRHALKYGTGAPTQGAIVVLSNLLVHFTELTNTSR